MLKKFAWAISSLITVVIIVLLLQVIYHASTLHEVHYGNFASYAELDKYLDNYIKKYSPHNKPILIPTGLFLQSLSFVNSNTVHVSGYLWQKYTDALLAKIKPGFIFSEAVGHPFIYEEYKIKENGTTVFGWHFDADITENFDYSKYPLDNKTFRFRIWPKEAGNIILTPDFESYESTKPHSMFGIDSKIALRNFDLLDNYFKYDLTNYNTNLGMKNFVMHNFPELHFNIDFHRQFLDAFVIILFPMVVVLIFTFLSLLIATTRMEDERRFGFKLSEILRGSALFLFIVLLAHTNLRNNISAGKIMYIEYIYFVLYASLIYVALNAFVLIKGSPEKTLVKFFRYQDNLIPKIIFLPCFFAVLLWISEKVLF